jgi:hypothetical protein
MRIAVLALLAACASSSTRGDPSGVECTQDSECTITVYNRRVSSPERCMCKAMCGDSVPKRLAKEYEKLWKEHCSDGGAKSSPLAAGCTYPVCRDTGRAVCEAGRCAVGEK